MSPLQSLVGDQGSVVSLRFLLIAGSCLIWISGACGRRIHISYSGSEPIDEDGTSFIMGENLTLHCHVHPELKKRQGGKYIWITLPGDRMPSGVVERDDEIRLWPLRIYHSRLYICLWLLPSRNGPRMHRSHSFPVNVVKRPEPEEKPIEGESRKLQSPLEESESSGAHLDNEQSITMEEEHSP